MAGDVLRSLTSQSRASMTVLKIYLLGWRMLGKFSSEHRLDSFAFHAKAFRQANSAHPLIRRSGDVGPDAGQRSLAMFPSVTTYMHLAIPDTVEILPWFFRCTHHLQLHRLAYLIDVHVPPRSRFWQSEAYNSLHITCPVPQFSCQSPCTVIRHVVVVVLIQDNFPCAYSNSPPIGSSIASLTTLHSPFRARNR